MNGEAAYTDVGLSSIGQYCHNLESFTVIDAYSIENIDQGLTALAQSCPQLKILRLYACHNLSDVGHMAVAQQCTRLQELSIMDNVLTTDASLMAFAHSVGANLMRLSLMICRGIGTGAGILATAMQLSHLHTVVFSYLDFCRGR